MHDQWYFSSELIREGLYLIEVVHSGKFITFTPERSTLVQQDQNIEKQAECQLFRIEHVGYRDYVIRHQPSGLVLTVHNGSPSPCAPIVLSRFQGVRTAYQLVNFERANDQSNDYLIFFKQTRMVIDIDGGSSNSNARLLQYPQKRNQINQPNQLFRLRPVFDPRASSFIPRHFLR